MKNKILHDIKKFLDKLQVSIMHRILFFKFGPGHRHWHTYWPNLKIEFRTNGRHEVFYKGQKVFMAQSFAELQKSAYNEIVIFGAGPSVKQMDLDKVKPQTAILVNGAMGLANKLPGGPLLCAVLDYSFLRDKLCKDMLYALPPGTNLLVSDDFFDYAFKRDRHMFDKFNVYIACNPIHPHWAQKIEMEDLPPQHFRKGYGSVFSYDPQYGMFDGGTILTWAIQMAYYLRAKTTYILGLDLGNFAEPHFYETEKNKIVSVGLLRDYQKIENFMRLASEAFAEARLKIFNCSPITKLPYSIFPFNDYFLKNNQGN